MSLTRRSLSFVAGSVFAALLLTALPGASAERKVLRVGVTAAPLNLDPKETVDSVSGLVSAQVFDTPYFVAPGSTATQPRLFATPLRADGPLTWSAPVRAGIVFSDGTPFTAAHAVASLSRVKLVSEKATLRAEGARVVFALRSPDALLETTLSQNSCGIELEKEGKFLGTGPYMPAPNASLNAMVLVRNPRCLKPPAIDEIRFQVYRPTTDGNVSGLVNALKRGDVDYATGIPAQELPQLAKLPGLEVSVGQGKSTGIFFFQVEKPGPLQDVKIRRAIARAIDRAELSRRFFDGNATFAAKNLLPPAMGSFEPDGLTYDLAAAEALVKDSKVAKPITLDILETWTSRPYAPNPNGICRYVADQLGKIGIKSKVMPSGGTTTFFEKLDKGDFDIVLAGWIADTHEAIDFLEVHLASWAISGNRCASCNNASRYKSKSVDDAIREYHEKRSPAALASILKTAREDVPFFPVLNGASTAVYSKRLKGYKATPLTTTQFALYDLSN
ncbi:MAG: ABC transporter substrate-binding protein [Thermoanaerobaculia bacterium]